MVIEYTIVDPGQKETRNQPGIKPTIGFVDIKVNGDHISEVLFNTLMEQHETEWVIDILESLKGIDRNVY
ncbi:MAG: hypothetical protein KAJ18_12160 [Candidatus Omnitrophica bacterium]|nr:hypothetical protein [Candidatus Omnitrophota bacterium]